MVGSFKIWHYSGALLYERPWNKQEELWEVLWQNFPTGVFRTPAITSKPVEGIQPSQPTGTVTQCQGWQLHANCSTGKLQHFYNTSS